MVRNTFILSGICLLLFLFPSASAAVLLSDYEDGCGEYGNKYEVRTFSTSTAMTTAGSVMGTSFRCQEDITVTRVGLFLSARTGTWTNIMLQFGLMPVNGTYGNSTRMWLGATQNGYGSVVPVAGWNTVLLNEPVTLTAGSMYLCAMWDKNGNLSGVRSVSVAWFTDYSSSIRSCGTQGYYEERNRLVWEYGATKRLEVNGGAWFITDGSAYQGNVYTGVSSWSAYTIGALVTTSKQTFSPLVSSSYDALFLVVHNNAYAYPAMPLMYEIGVNSTGEVLVSGVLCEPSAVPAYAGRWYMRTDFTDVLTLSAGVLYYLKTWSAGSSTNGWSIASSAAAGTGLPLYAYQLSFGGNESCVFYSTDNGTTWSSYKQYDYIFKLRESGESEVLAGVLSFDPWLMLFSLFLSFFYLGYKSEKRSGGFFLLFAGFAMIGLGILAGADLLLVNTLTTPIGIFILLLGGRKAFYGPESTEKELNADVTGPEARTGRRRRKKRT